MSTETLRLPRFGSTYSPAVGKARTALDEGAHRLAVLAAVGGDPSALLAHSLDAEASGAVVEWLRREMARAEERDALVRVVRRVGPERVRALAVRLRDATTWAPLDPPRGWLRRDLARALDVSPRTAASEVVARLASAGVTTDASDPTLLALLAQPT